MRKVAECVRSHYKVVSVVGVLVGVGISAFTLVQAAIPDTDGTIRGCRNSTTTLLRVIDSASQSCDSNETALSWDQKGVRGYGRITSTGSNNYSIDTNRSYNISNLHVSNLGFQDNLLCFTVAGTPKNISITPEDSQTTWALRSTGIEDTNGWTNSANGSTCDQIDSTTNAFARVTTNSFFVTVH